MEPPPYTPTFADIPSDVGMLFRRAFERGSEKGSRPTPSDWLHALQQLEQSTVECSADPGHQYWRGANRCVWCQLASNGGPEYYFGVAVGATVFAVDEAKLQEVTRQLNACRASDLEYKRDRFASPHPLEGEPLSEELNEQRSTTTILAGAIAVCLLMMPLGLIRGFIFVIGFLGAAALGTWLAVLHWLSPLHQEKQRRRMRLAGERSFAKSKTSGTASPVGITTTTTK